MGHLQGVITISVILAFVFLGFKIYLAGWISLVISHTLLAYFYSKRNAKFYVLLQIISVIIAAMKIYSSPSMREVQRLIEKDETDMHARSAAQSEAEQKQQQAMMEAQAEKEGSDRQMENEHFYKEDETKRYLGELKAETDRINKLNEDNDVSSPETEIDDRDFEKFSKELDIKQQGLDNDMSKHRDNLGIKEKELTIKKKAANKPTPTAAKK